MTGSTGFTEAQIEAGLGGFKRMIGDITVDRAGTVIDHAWISGCVAINATGVTIENTLITTTDRCHGGNQRALGGAINDGGTGARELHANLVVKDTEVDGQNVRLDTTGVGAVYFECLRCNVHGFTHDIAPADHGAVVNSYLHDLTTGAVGSHEETIYADSAADFTAEHNFLRASAGNGFVAGAIFAGNTFGAGNGMVVHDNYLEGDQGSDLVIGCSNSNVDVGHNAFSRRAASYGYVSGAASTAGFWSLAGNTWTGNYDSLTRATISRIAESGCKRQRRRAHG